MLIAEDGENLRTRKTPIAFLAKDKFWVNNHAHIVQANERADTRFLMYALTNTEISGYLTGSTIPKLTQDNLSRLPIWTPPLDEQRRIAATLGAFDDKIELNRRENAALEATARALFKSWFVDFDPVHAKVQRRAPQGMDAQTAALFPDAFEESALGSVPQGWEVGSILNHNKLLSGGTPKTDHSEYWGGNILWASAKDVSQAGQTFLISPERTITDRGLAESATQLIPMLSTVIVARGATTGRMVLLGREMAMNQTCYAMFSTIGTPFSLYSQLTHEIGTLVHSAHGSVFDTITTSTFASSSVVIPPISIFKAFEKIVSPIFLQILNNSEESRTLAETRDALLPKLLSGEVRV